MGGGGKVLILRNIIGRNAAVEITPKKACRILRIGPVDRPFRKDRKSPITGQTAITLRVFRLAKTAIAIKILPCRQAVIWRERAASR